MFPTPTGLRISKKPPYARVSLRVRMNEKPVLGGDERQQGPGILFSIMYLLVCEDYQPVLSVPDTQGSQDLEKPPYARVTLRVRMAGSWF